MTVIDRHSLLPAPGPRRSVAIRYCSAALGDALERLRSSRASRGRGTTPPVRAASRRNASAGCGRRRSGRSARRSPGALERRPWWHGGGAVAIRCRPTAAPARGRPRACWTASIARRSNRRGRSCRRHRAVSTSSCSDRRVESPESTSSRADSDHHRLVRRPERAQENPWLPIRGGEALAGHAEAAIDRNRHRRGNSPRRTSDLLRLAVLADAELVPAQPGHRRPALSLTVA